MLHILNNPKLGHTVGKNVCSRLTLGKMCSNSERCVFRALSMGALFYRSYHMKKLNLTIFLCITCAFSLIFGLTGCKDSHTHSYSKQITSATCTGQGYTTYTCECGDFYLDEYVGPLSHSFTNYVSDDNASCEHNATETARCDRTGCNEVHTREVEQTATGHNYGNPTYDWANNYSTVTATAICKNNNAHKITETVNTTATITQEQKCEQVELTKFTATFENTLFNVQVKDNIQTKGFLSHSFTNYDYNEDASCTTDGTKTAKCDRCSETDTIIAEGTKLNHTYTNNICGCGAENFTTSLIFELSDDNSSYTVVGTSSSSDTAIIIPSNYNGKPVTAIGYEAFNESVIQSVTFGNNISSIEAWAFRGCININSITLPESLINISEGSFAGCAGITSVVMQNNVTQIGKMAFYQCSNLSAITLSNKLQSIGVGAFADNSKLEVVTLPETLIKIDEQAFIGCSKLSSIDIPNNVEYIEDYAFAECVGLKSLTIGTSSLKIGARSFMECESLTSLFLPSNVEYIDIQAFAYCTSLTEVIISNGIDSINSAAFQGCTKMKYMELPFIGHTEKQDQFLGWIFGICSWYLDNPTYVPSSLQAIGYTGNTIPANALYGCDHIEVYYYCATNSHIVVIDKAVEPTCQETGLTEGSHCSKCNKIIIMQENISKSSHNYVNDVCTLCGNSIAKQTELDAEEIRHTEVVITYTSKIKQYTKYIENAKTAYDIENVTEGAGYFRTLIDQCNTNIQNLRNNISYCELREQTYGVDLTTQKLDYQAKIELEKEIKSRYEKYLSIAEYQEELAFYEKALSEEFVIHTNNIELIESKYYCLENGHTNIVVDKGQNATCGKVGLSEGTHCEDCHTIIEEQIVTPIIGHSYGNDDKCTVCGLPKPSAGLKYTLRSDGVSYSVSKGTCTDKNIVIADTYNGLPVVEIEEKGFYKATITSIIIPENIKIIRDYAFFRCEKLQYLSLPSSLENIGNMSFYYCSMLQSIDFNGNTEQWIVIGKISGWDSGIGNSNLPNYTIYCTDGEIVIYHGSIKN